MGFARQASRNELGQHRLLEHGLTRCLEIIGEAANQLSDEALAEMPGIPWAQVVAMRNRLIHAYFSVDLDYLWDTVTRDLPPLLSAVEEFLAENTSPLPGE